MSGLEYYAKTHEVEWLQEQIYDLQNTINRLQSTLDELTEKLERVTTTPPITIYPTDPDPLIGVSKCFKCGMEWKGIMSYSCPNGDCPVQMKVISGIMRTRRQ